MMMIALAVIIGISVHFVYKISNRETPEEPISKARKALSEAIACLAHLYEPGLYRKSESLYSDAMNEWQLENKKPIYKRNYNRIINLAKKSKLAAEEACTKSRKKALNEKAYLNQLYQYLKKQRTKFNGTVNKFPIPKNIVKDFHHADLLMRESGELIEQKEFLLARKKLDLSSKLFSSSTAYIHSYLKNYFLSYPTWQEWTKQGIRYSENNGVPMILIDKMAHKCYVYNNGKVVHEFEIEMGKNWVGQKTREGDLATPEGNYKVVSKKSGSKTIYHKALLLDYPNESDIRRIRELTMGKKHHRPGSMIEIHGHGDQGFNWTKGCIALSDKDIDKVFALVQVGTKVVIVGSLEPFKIYEKLYFE